MELNIIPEALQNFEKNSGIKCTWIKEKQLKTDHSHGGVLQFSFNHKKHMFTIQVSKYIALPNLPAIAEKQKQSDNLIFLAWQIPEQVAENLRNMNVNYLDAVGNVFIKSNDIFIMIEGNKHLKQPRDLRAKAFSKTGLKIVFQFLLYPQLINESMRNIASQADVSLDTVHKTIQGLKEIGYLFPLNHKRKGWINRKEMFEKWIEEYQVRLKPTLHMGNFRFINGIEFLKWDTIHLNENTTCWGGEPAGEILTHHLKPETLTVYTKENKMEMIKNYRLIPDPKGYFKVYQKFWNKDENKFGTAPPLLIYADLINTGEKRNIDIAKSIYEQFIQDKF